MARRTAGWWGLRDLSSFSFSVLDWSPCQAGVPRCRLLAVSTEIIWGSSWWRRSSACSPLWYFCVAVGLQRQAGGRALLLYAGIAVAAASVVTAVPVLWLCMAASTVTPAMLAGLLVASDMADAVLFLAIAGFATAIAIGLGPMGERPPLLSPSSRLSERSC